MMQEKPSRQNKVLVYTFFSYTKKMSKLLFDAQLDYADKYFINSRLPDKNFLEKIRNYELVVGIADNKKNAKVNRLEAVYRNLYGKHKINEDGLGNYCPNIIFNEEELENYEISYKASNGPCNMSGYMAIHQIKMQNLSTKFVFFHLMKCTSENDLKDLLDKLMKWNL